MNIDRPALEKIISNMVARRKRAKVSAQVDVVTISIIESIIACATHQLSLENGEWSDIKQGAEELLREQARLMQHEKHMD